MLSKMPGEEADKFANLRAGYGYMMTHPGKKLLFMGQDIAEYDEWKQKDAGRGMGTVKIAIIMSKYAGL